MVFDIADLGKEAINILRSITTEGGCSLERHCGGCPLNEKTYCAVRSVEEAKDLLEYLESNIDEEVLG